MNQPQPSAKTLVKPVLPSDAPPAAAELAFLMDSAGRWRLRLENPVVESHDALAQAVAADPRALEWHLRRIHYCYSQRDGDELYGALLDLFIFLEGRGHALRRRLLAGVRDLLGAEEFAVLRRGVAQGRLPPETGRPRSPRSRFSEGVQGVLELVRPQAAAGRGPVRDALVEAREHIEFSQLEQAREVLEAAVLRQPQREDLQHELLSLYRAMHDGKNFARMRENLRQVSGSLPTRWDDLDGPTAGGQPS